MKCPEKAAVNENVAGGSKLTGNAEASRVSDGKRSASDERRFQNALEDDGVREALRVLRGTGPIARRRTRP